MKSIFASRWLAVLMFTIMFLQSGHAFQTIYPVLSYALYLPALIALIIIFANAGKSSSGKKQDIRLWVFLIMIGATMIADLGSGIHFYIRLLCFILAAYAFSKMYSFETTVNCYLTVMTVISVVALIGYYFANNTTVLSFLPQINNTNDVRYAVGGIFNYIVNIPERNCGMFWEPGLFATHLVVALVLELMTKEKASLLRLILFSVCIFTANSSAGFALWLLCLVLMFVRRVGKNLASFKTVLALIIVLAAVVVVVNFDTILTETSLGENEYIQKLSLDSITESSREKAIGHNMELFWSSPFIGVGYAEAARNMSHVADTSTSTYLMSIFGFLAVFYTVFIIWGILKIKDINWISKLLIIAIALIIVNKEPHYQIMLTWVMIFYSSKDSGEQKERQKSRYIKAIGV